MLNNAFASSFVLKSEKPQRKLINYCSKHTVKMQWVIHKCLIAKVRTIVHNDRRQTVREIADDCGISVGSCDAILTDNLYMKQKNGGMATGSHMTMRPHTLHILCSSFWPNTALLSCSSHHIHKISRRVTFNYSLGLRKF